MRIQTDPLEGSTPFESNVPDEVTVVLTREELAVITSIAGFVSGQIENSPRELLANISREMGEYFGVGWQDAKAHLKYNNWSIGGSLSFNRD